MVAIGDRVSGSSRQPEFLACPVTQICISSIAASHQSQHPSPKMPEQAFVSALRIPTNRLTLTLAALAASAFVLPAAYRDYQIFKSYGPGGVPNNALGWILVRVLFQPFGREMLSTEEYVRRIEAAEGHGKGDDGFLALSGEPLGSRGARPVVGPHVVPQRQLTQIPDEAVMEVCL